jgi:hypothetical protein
VRRLALEPVAFFGRINRQGDNVNPLYSQAGEDEPRDHLSRRGVRRRGYPADLDPDPRGGRRRPLVHGVVHLRDQGGHHVSTGKEGPIVPISVAVGLCVLFLLALLIGAVTFSVLNSM